MKTLEELQVGKWYQNSNWFSKQDYVKYKDAELSGGLNKIWFDENISHGKYDKRRDYWNFNISTLREVPVEEIQQYLPDGHPDKLVEKSLVGRYVKCLRDGANHCSVAKKYVKEGEYYKIDSIEINSYRLKDGNYCGSINKPDSQFKGIGFELMPEGFTPPKELRELPEKWIPKFKVGDKVRIPLSKKGNIWYKNNVSELDNYHKDYFIISGIGSNTNIGLSRADGKNFRENSFCEDDLILYVESTSEAWVPKVGDWVVVKSYSQAGHGNGISEDNLVSKLYIAGFDNASGMLLREAAFSVKQGKRFYNIIKSHIIRKAEPWEIPPGEQTTKISMVDLSIPDFYTIDNYGVGPITYPHFNYRAEGDPAITTKPKTPKKSFKLNKLPTKSWY